ncbi:MAG: HEAT repeat domain-containing protein [Dysgonamonadaceae bacterium]|jgi:HEAT repeat protein|nr:HEAT repeat domain-containing protein [Dysgonamonadaceae bacterium]
MKKINYILGILLLNCCLLVAQSPQNSAVSATITDALSQLPAPQQQQYDQLMTNLLSTGEEGVLMMVKMMKLPADETAIRAEYALNGLSRYVSAEGREKEQSMLAAAFGKVLDSMTNKQVKAFILRQLAIIGSVESLPALTACLSDNELSAPALAALKSIGGTAVQTALLSALSLADATNQKSIVYALGDLALPLEEKTLQALLGGGDRDLDKAVLYALSHCGTKKSLSKLGDLAKKVGYTTEYTGANEAYILLIKRLLEQGDTKTSGKAAADLLKKATKAGQAHSRMAALEILLQAADPHARDKQILKALADPNRAFRNVALASVPENGDESLLIGIVEKLEKADAETQIDILNWFGNCPNPLSVQTLSAYLNDEDSEISMAAGLGLVKTGDESVIPALADLLTSEDLQQIALGTITLKSFDGDICPDVAYAMGKAKNAGIVAALDLLAARKADRYSGEVFSRLADPNSVVKSAAFKALKDVVLEKDLPALFNLLNNSAIDAITPLQQAIIAALGNQSSDSQFEAVNSQMKAAPTDKQYRYYKLLGSTGSKQALPILKEGYLYDRGIAKSLAFEAYLTLLDSPEFTPEEKTGYLSEAMEHAQEDEQRNGILRKIGNTGTLQALIYAGNYLDDKVLQQTAANVVMNIALSHPEYKGETVRSLLTKTATVLDNPDASYQREAIRKHLNEMPQGD